MSDTKLCQHCDGCGQIANDDEGTPWTFWVDLPVKSAAAVILGLVRPIPCPKCHGTGAVPVAAPAAEEAKTQ
jgi:RecJ-like exonuclease